MLDVSSGVELSTRPDVSVWLPGIPRGKGRPRSMVMRKRDTCRPFVHVYSDGETVSYEAELKFAAEKAMRGRRPLDEAMCCRVTALFPWPGSWSEKKKLQITNHTVKPDGDNILKCLDALKGVVWSDDSRVSEWLIRKIFDDIPGLLIEVWVI